ncbi:hypothetical protein WA158_000381 [Blastocystis sp. Blastoise]
MDSRYSNRNSYNPSNYGRRNYQTSHDKSYDTFRGEKRYADDSSRDSNYESKRGYGGRRSSFQNSNRNVRAAPLVDTYVPPPEPEEKKTESDSYKANVVVADRNKRMIGGLLSYLTKARSAIEKDKSKIDSQNAKIKEAEQKDREEAQILREISGEVMKEQKEQQLEEKWKAKSEGVCQRLQGLKETAIKHIQSLAPFFCTETNPSICWIPSKSSPFTDTLKEKRQQQIQAEIQKIEESFNIRIEEAKKIPLVERERYETRRKLLQQRQLERQENGNKNETTINNSSDLASKEIANTDNTTDVPATTSTTTTNNNTETNEKNEDNQASNEENNNKDIELKNKEEDIKENKEIIPEISEDKNIESVEIMNQNGQQEEKNDLIDFTEEPEKQEKDIEN